MASRTLNLMLDGGWRLDGGSIMYEFVVVGDTLWWRSEYRRAWTRDNACRVTDLKVRGDRMNLVREGGFRWHRAR